MLIPLLKKLVSLPRPYYVAGAFIWGAAILIILLLPSSSVPRLRIPHADKAVHAGMFFLLAYFIWFALKGTVKQSTQSIATFLLVAGYGALTEYIQQSAATRTADVYDAVADAAGAVLFLIVMPEVLRRLVPTRGGS